MGSHNEREKSDCEGQENQAQKKKDVPLSTCTQLKKNLDENLCRKRMCHLQELQKGKSGEGNKFRLPLVMGCRGGIVPWFKKKKSEISYPLDLPEKIEISILFCSQKCILLTRVPVFESKKREQIKLFPKRVSVTRNSRYSSANAEKKKGEGATS